MAWRPKKPEMDGAAWKKQKDAKGAAAKTAASSAADGSTAQLQDGGKGRKTRRGRRKLPTVSKPVVRDKGLKGMVTAMAKVSLQAAQTARAAYGVVTDTVMLPATSAIALAVEEEGSAYSTRVEGIHQQLAQEMKESKEHEEALKELKLVQAPAKGNLMAVLEAMVENNNIGLKKRDGNSEVLGNAGA